ncbi:hypothetical protein HMPREF0307_00510 [Corynebacterium sp. DNF00584]|nr:hypothetical protein HMPREF0307_00510 [Corynebacterium sp. DNF00584]
MQAALVSGNSENCTREFTGTLAACTGRVQRHASPSAGGTAKYE